MATILTGNDLYRGANNLEILRGIMNHKQAAKIEVGQKTVTVDLMTASALVTVHDALGIEGKAKFVGMLHHSTGTFYRLVAFAWKHVEG